jgi:2-keto-myo-inositol isomerase
MLLGWNGSTSMTCTLETDIVSASSAGYDCLEIRSCKLADFLREKTPEDLADLLRRHHLPALSINAIENANLAGTEDFVEAQAECHKLCEVARGIDCEYVIAAPAPKPASMSMQEVFDQSVEALRDLAAIAQEYNVKLAFEFLGFQDCSVRSVVECCQIIDAAKADNLRMVIDTFHFHLGGLGADALKEMDISCLSILHIADAEDLPRNQLQDANRLLPGDGVIPLPSILAALNEKNYAGAISLELFRPELWEWDPAELARLCKRKILDVCKKAGVCLS